MSIKYHSEKFDIYNADCFGILQNMLDNHTVVDAIICDPPYNIDYESWDHSFDIEKALNICSKILKPNGNLILFQGWTNVSNTKQIGDNYFRLQNWIIWDRIKGRGAKHNLVSTREDILWYCNGDSPTYTKMYSDTLKRTGGLGLINGNTTRALSNVWSDISPIVPWSNERNGHPTQKPLKLMERCVKLWTNEGDTILDFTMGSGTTGEAAIRLNRKFIGIENDESWYEIAKSRLIQAAEFSRYTKSKL